MAQEIMRIQISCTTFKVSKTVCACSCLIERKATPAMMEIMTTSSICPSTKEPKGFCGKIFTKVCGLILKNGDAPDSILSKPFGRVKFRPAPGLKKVTRAYPKSEAMREVAKTKAPKPRPNFFICVASLVEASPRIMLEKIKGIMTIFISARKNWAGKTSQLKKALMLLAIGAVNSEIGPSGDSKRPTTTPKNMAAKTFAHNFDLISP